MILGSWGNDKREMIDVGNGMEKGRGLGELCEIGNEEKMRYWDLEW